VLLAVKDVILLRKKTRFFHISHFCRAQKVSSYRRKNTSTNVFVANTF
jgi:hypothetical protein